MVFGVFCARLARPACCLCVLLAFVVSPAHAQIIGDFSGSITPDSMAKGDATKGFGFAALRYEDKMRMKKLRQRYIELNPKNKGIVEVYDIDTDVPEDGPPPAQD